LERGRQDGPGFGRGQRILGNAKDDVGRRKVGPDERDGHPSLGRDDQTAEDGGGHVIGMAFEPGRYRDEVAPREPQAPEFVGDERPGHDGRGAGLIFVHPGQGRADHLFSDPRPVTNPFKERTTDGAGNS